MSIDLTQGLLRDLRRIYETADDYNVILKVGRGYDINNFHAHSVILRNRSDYFRSVLTEYVNKRGDGLSKLFKKGDYITLEMPHISAEAFKFIIGYIYTGVFSLSGINNQEFILELIFAADELKLYDLVKYLQIYIIKTGSSWIKNNLIKIYQKSSNRENTSIIQEYCMELINNEPILIFKSHSSFFSLAESDLLKLIRREDLGLQEIEVWRYLINWGIAQDPPIIGDVKTWNSEDFGELERRLHNLMPYVRFFSIPAHQYYEYIRPYSKILPIKLKDDIEAFYILQSGSPPSDALPPRALYRNRGGNGNGYNVNNNVNATRVSPRFNTSLSNQPPIQQVNRDLYTVPPPIPTPAPTPVPPYIPSNRPKKDEKSQHRHSYIEREMSPILNIANFNSTLINKNQAKRIVRWIDEYKNLRVCGDTTNHSNMLNLLVRGNKDGISQHTFHSLCDNRGPTIVLAKVEKTMDIIGGYNPKSWTSTNKWIETTESFIFSFKSDGNREGIDDIILSRIKNPSAAIFDGDRNYDVGFSNDIQFFLGTYTHQNYEKRIMADGNFKIVDFEVYQVKKIIDYD